MTVLRPDRPALGIVFMLGFCVLAPLADALAKVIGDRVPLLQLVAIRFVVQAVVLAPLALALGHSLRVGPRLLGLLALRTLLHILGIALIFLALRHMPLADAIAIAYVMPFVLLLLAHLFLGEEVGWRRMVACAVGFAGTLLVMQPSFAEIGWLAALPLVVAVIFAVFMLLTRYVARDLDPVALQAVNGVMGAVGLAPLLALAEGSGLVDADPIWPPAGLAWLLLAMGGVGTLAHLCLTAALRHAPAATLGPMQYLEIPVAVALGWLIFADFPNGLALAGIAVVMAAGLFIVVREHRLTRSMPQ